MKDPGQKRILAIDITREGFEWALKNSCSSHRDPSMSDAEWRRLKNQSPVRIQWDPERDIHLNPLPYRAIQIGLSGEAVERYVRDWIQHITDSTPLANQIRELLTKEDARAARQKLPKEREYLGRSQG